MKGSIEDLRQAVLLNPIGTSHQKELADELEVSGEIAEAMQRYQNCLFFDPSDSRAAESLKNLKDKNPDVKVAGWENFLWSLMLRF